MTVFLKHFFLAVLLQLVAVGALLGIRELSPGLGVDPVDVSLWLYWPTAFAVAELGHYTGCSGFIYPFWFGVPSGILAYALLYSCIVALINLTNNGHQER